MNSKNKIILIITVVLSISIWGVGLYTGWIKEVALFGYSIFSSWFDENKAYISEDSNIKTVKYGQFAYRLLPNINIPNNINLIEDKAFKGNKLTSITIGSDVTLGRDSFGYNFENVYNRNNKNAGTYTRTDHKSNEWIIWYEDYSYSINNGNISITGFKGTSTVIIPDDIYGYPVTVIADNTFKNKRLTTVTISNSVISIGNEAFRNNQITNLIIGNSVTNIGNNAFDENQLTRLIIPNSVTIIGNNAFCCNQLNNLTIGNSVTKIGNAAFAGGNIGKGQLTSIFLPNSVTDIGFHAFSDHPITRVSIGANVTLASGDSQTGILGRGTGFNTAYTNNNRRAAVYSRSNINSSQWSRTAR